MGLRRREIVGLGKHLLLQESLLIRPCFPNLGKNGVLLQRAIPHGARHVEQVSVSDPSTVSESIMQYYYFMKLKMSKGLPEAPLRRKIDPRHVMRRMVNC